MLAEPLPCDFAGWHFHAIQAALFMLCLSATSSRLYSASQVCSSNTHTHILASVPLKQSLVLCKGAYLQDITLRSYEQRTYRRFGSASRVAYSNPDTKAALHVQGHQDKGAAMCSSMSRQAPLLERVP